jgi:hypothetical protein
MFIGVEATPSSLSGAVEYLCIGIHSGKSITSGDSNTFLGYKCGDALTEGVGNTYIGHNSGGANIAGSTNVAVGANSSWLSTTGNNNVYIGYGSGQEKTSGNTNVMIGRDSGRNNSTSSGNVFIGYNAGMNEAGANKLYIENSNSATPLIYGEFDNDLLTFNADVTIPDGKKLRVGTGLDGQIYSSSDNLYIENITSDKDIYLRGNDGGVTTDIMILDVSAGQLSGMQKAVSGVMTNAVAGTDYISPTGTETLTNKNIQRPINGQTGTTYTFALTDAGKVVTFTNANAQTITVPKNSVVTFPVGTQIDCVGLGAGKVTFAPVDGDVTINSKGSNKAIGAQYVGVTLLKTDTNTWSLLGDLIA